MMCAKKPKNSPTKCHMFQRQVSFSMDLAPGTCLRQPVLDDGQSRVPQVQVTPENFYAHPL